MASCLDVGFHLEYLMYLQHALMSCRGLIRSRVVLGMSLWRNSCRQVAAALSGKSEAVSLLNNFCIAHQGQAEHGRLWAGRGGSLRGYTGHELLHCWADPSPGAPELCQSVLLLLVVLLLRPQMMLDLHEAGGHFQPDSTR